MTIADKVRRAKSDLDAAHAAGVEEGKTAGGYTEGFEAGKQAEYDAFWDVFQRNGERADYQYGGFGGIGWTDETFKPKYTVKPLHCYNMFTGCGMTEIRGVDFSTTKNMENTFAFSQYLELIGEINAPLVTTMTRTFRLCPKLKTIEKLTVSANTKFTTIFQDSTALKNITFEGEIGQDLDVSPCTKLTKASIENIVNHLSDTASGKTLTLSEAAVNEAFRGYGAIPDYPTQGEVFWGDVDGKYSMDWSELIAPKIGTEENPKWAISLV